MENISKHFNDSIHRDGRISTFIIILLFFSIPLGITLYYSVELDVSLIVTTTLPLAVMMGIIGTIEKFSMTPIVGPGAVYVSSITGNVSNMKFPVAINAMNTTNYPQGSERGEIVALIAVTSSAMITTIIIFIGVLFLAPVISPILNNPIMIPAFNNMIPALLGAMGAPFVLKNPKLAVTPLIVASCFVFIFGNKYSTFSGLLLPIIIISSVLVAYLIHRKSNHK